MAEADNTMGSGEPATPAGKDFNLADLVEERGALPEPEVLKTFIEVLGGLDAAHREGMLHRDINPTRIVLDGGWKLIDFGQDKVGTVRYMSPERCQGKPVDVRSDVYSLGVALYLAATGKLPFDAEMKFQVMDAHIGTPPPPPRATNPAVSVELEQVILKALAKSPTDRFQTAAEFRQALGAVPGAAELVKVVPPAPADTETQTVEVLEPVGLGEPSPQSKRLKPAVILVPLAAAVVTVVGLLLTGIIGTRRVPAVTGRSNAEAEQAVRAIGFRIEADTIDDTLPAGTVTAQEPEAGGRWRRSMAVRLTVSSGRVEVPLLGGLALADARAKLAQLALTPGKVDSQFSDKYAAGAVIAGDIAAGTKVTPHSSVGLTVSTGLATCPDCGAPREARAKFCTRCGYKY